MLTGLHTVGKLESTRKSASIITRQIYFPLALTRESCFHDAKWNIKDNALGVPIDTLRICAGTYWDL